MTLSGLSPWTFLVGALALAGSLVALHLLRVRLRRVEVDTLLFFRLAGALQKPRVLPGAPARWLAFLLALLGAWLGWAALAAPRAGLADRSRIVIVEPDATTAAERVAQVQELLAAGLGPRGMVLAATSPPRVLLRAGEPVAAMTGRADALATGACARSTQAALQAAADQLGDGDELVWLGAEAAALPGVTVAHVPVARAPAVHVTDLAWQRTGNGEWTLAVRGRDLPDGELRQGDTVLARAAGAKGLATLRLGPCAPAPAAALTLALPGLEPLAVPLPEDPPLRVFVAQDLGNELARAVAAVLAVDGELAQATAAANADVVVAAADDANDPRPRLVLTSGAGEGPRTAVLTAAAPVHVSLRDGKRRSATALPALPEGATVWIADAAQGGALAAAVVAGGRPRILLVDWLLLPIARADTPALLATALRALGGRPRALLLVAGQPHAVPAAFAAPARAGGTTVHAVDGTWLLASDAPGTTVLQAPGGGRTLTTLAPRGTAAAPAASPAVLAALGGDGSFVPWLLLALLLLLAADAILFHRGRLP